MFACPLVETSCIYTTIHLWNVRHIACPSDSDRSRYDHTCTSLLSLFEVVTAGELESLLGV